MKNKLYYTYTETTTGGGALSDEQFSDRAPAYIDWQLKDIFTKPPKHTPYYGEITIKDDIKNIDHFYFVIVKYSDGDTFGTTYGHCVVANVFIDGEKAFALAEKIQNEEDRKEDLAPECHKCWNGYFASFEDAFVETRRIMY